MTTRSITNNPRTNTTVIETTQLLQLQVMMLYKLEVIIRTVLVPQTVRQSLVSRVISVAFVPFIRQRTISFTAQGMRPNTQVFPFFDNIAISVYVTPSVNSINNNLVTDEQQGIKYFCNT